MFTGIVTDLGTVRQVRPADGQQDSRFVIATGYDLSTVAIGASIACGGPCMTVIEKGDDWFAVEASAESLARTTMADWKPGTRINLERALTAGDELGGHIVTGHIDAVTRIAAIGRDAGSAIFSFALPAALSRFIAEKGSVTLDGVSLTVNDVRQDSFDINIIAHTQAVTSFGTRAVGDRINLEVDILARYVDRQLMAGGGIDVAGKRNG